MQVTRIADAAAVGLSDIETPASEAGILLNPKVAEIAARLGVALLKRPVRFRNWLVVARHCDVSAVLRRDLEFRIAPVNAARIEGVNDPFILGMDRSDQLIVERRALYSALATIDLAPLLAAAEADADDLIAAAGQGPIDVVGGYARIVAGRTAERLFGAAPPDEASFREVARAIFAHTFLNLGGDPAIEGKALRAAKLLRTWLTDEITRRRAAGETGEDLMGALMRQAVADETGARGPIDDDGVRRTLGGMLVGSVDTTASSVAKIVAMLGRDAALRAAALRDVGEPERLLGWCREALRRWPHNPILLRKTVAAATLSGVLVPAGTTVVAWTQAAMNDPEAFPEPRQMRPDRPAAAYLHFGGGLHPCAGRLVNDLQIPMLVGKLLRRGLESVGSVAWAGPFPNRLEAGLGRA